jgi:hypothetical protein
MQKRDQTPIKRRWLLLPLAVILVGANVTGQDSSGNEYTNGYPNGRFWEVLSNFEKVMYLRGFRDGLTLGAAGEVIPPKKVIEAMSEATDGYYAERFTYAVDVKEIDKLYAAGENILIPIPGALNYCAKKLRGTLTSAELEQILINLRKNSPAPEEKP